MQAPEAQDLSKSALRTVLKCGIPVTILVALVLYFYYCPQLLKDIWWMLMPSLFWFFNWLERIGHIVAPILASAGCLLEVATVVICAGFLWSSCALNHLKKQGLIEGIYPKMARSYKVFAWLATLLMFIHGLNMIGTASPENALDTITYYLQIAFAGFIGCGLLAYTDSKNKDLLEKGKK
jgi:hypothetical protein